MPSDLTIFAASYLVFLDGVLALGVLAWLLSRRPRRAVVRWAVGAVIMVGLSIVFSRIGGMIYNDPRPFTEDHVRPLIAHAADNGFPSDHALLAAAIVAAVLLASPLWCLPFVVLGAAVDWARVGAGIHHVQDVVGSSLLVLLATILALLLTPPIADRLTRLLPASVLGVRSSAVKPERNVEQGT